MGLLCLIAVAIIIAKNYHSADDSANTADGASPADDELQELRKALPELNAAKRLSPLRNTRLDKALWLHMNFEPETIVPHGEMLFVRDLSGKEHHGVCRLGRQIPGRVGNALDCDSPLRLLAGAINQAPQFTVLAWVRIPQSAAGAWWLEENMQGNCLFGAGCGNVLEIRALSKSKLTTGAPVAFADLPVPRDQWNFIALRSAVRNGDTFLMLQVNDQIHKGFNNSDLLPIHAAEAKSRLSFALTAGTQIGELMVFHAALSDADIQALRGNVKPWAVPASLALANAPVLAGAANAPVLAGPANGETLPNPDGITLNWQPMANADRYNVQVLPPWSAKPAVDEKDRHGTSVHVRLRNVMPKADCHGWHWHVRAEVGGQWTDWSETRSFDLAEPPDQGNAPPAEVKRPDQAQPGGRDVADVTERPAPAETPAEVRKPVRAPRQIVKVPMPSDKERAAAVKIVHDEYLKRYTAAGDDVQQRRALAQDMLKRADASADPATQYALMERAMTIAGNCGDLVPALAIADAIGRRFETDAVQLKYDSVMESLKANTIFMPDENQDAGNYVLDVMGQLECAGRYNDAVLLGSRYKERAGVSIKPDMARQITGELRAIGNAKLEKKNVADALEVLKTNPDDAAACAKVGRYRCLFQGDWSGGLPLLAKGNDAALRDMARMEQEGWSDDADALKLAEAWYDLAEKEPAGPSRLALYRRAKHWYTACMEGLSDSDRETAQKRIEQIDHLTEQ